MATHSVGEFIEMMDAAGHGGGLDVDGCVAVYRWVFAGHIGTCDVRHMQITWPAVANSINPWRFTLEAGESPDDMGNLPPTGDDYRAALDVLWEVFGMA